VPCTVIRRGDVADQILNTDRFPEYQGHRGAMIDNWPTNLDAWTNGYNHTRVEGIKNKDQGKAAAAYYKKHRAKMDKGAGVSWAARKHDDEVSAVQHAMNLWLAIGNAG